MCNLANRLLTKLEIDESSDDVIEFNYNGYICLIESTDGDTIKLSIEDNEIVSDSLDDLVDFFYESIDIQNHSAIDELAKELRIEFNGE